MINFMHHTSLNPVPVASTKKFCPSSTSYYGEEEAVGEDWVARKVLVGYIFRLEGILLKPNENPKQWRKFAHNKNHIMGEGT